MQNKVYRKDDFYPIGYFKSVLYRPVYDFCTPYDRFFNHVRSMGVQIQGSFDRRSIFLTKSDAMRLSIFFAKWYEILSKNPVDRDLYFLTVLGIGPSFFEPIPTWASKGIIYKEVTSFESGVI